MRLGLMLSCLLSISPIAIGAEGPIGRRPYEMDWVGRTQDDHPALVEFEDLDGWTVECKDAEARFVRTRQQQLWGQYVGTLTYRGTGPRPVIVVKPPRPIVTPGAFDCVNFWVYGNNWAWVTDRSTPPVDVAVFLKTKSGQEIRVPMGRVHWQEWWVMHRRLSPEQQAMVKDGAALVGIEISGGRNTEDRALHFDSLSVYCEPLRPLVFEPRPERNITPFPGQTTGTNTGPGRLPFPTREETILPDNLTAEFKVALESSGGEFAFHYRGKDGHLVYRYKPSSGTLGDVTAGWTENTPSPQPSPKGRGSSSAFQPMAEGGAAFCRDTKAGHAPPEKPAMKLLECKQAGDTVVARWQAACGSHTTEVVYTLRLWQKSLVVDVACLGGHVEEVRFGKAVGLKNARLVTLPYLMGAQQRPAVVVSGPSEKPLFLFGLVDHCRSNASALTFLNRASDDGVIYNGGARYNPKTDGRRNDCFERLFLTVSPRFEEVLPNVPNPKSPWMHVAGERLWIAHGASNRERDYALWKEVARYGMTKVVITDHETGWRDGGESFTFRTRAAPGKGGDPAQAEYAKKVRALGFRYGIYNNYTDFAPVNEHWSEDLVTRLSDGNWQTAWARCYNPKPSRAVEYEAKLAPIIQQKFQLDTAYCDVHTAVTPWNYCDYDARVPGAGTFAATFYAYGEIMLHQKKTWNGPVYSEGNNHWYYCGLTDGNYGQDQAARLDENPWLVDFDLRKLHPLCCNFGMGNPGMFFGREDARRTTSEEWSAKLDRFLAATLAFGHTGFLVMDGGMPSAVRSYFNLQAVHAAYAQATVKDIRYGDGNRNLLEPGAALATGVYKRSQVRTEYSNGLVVHVNGHPTEPWRLPEPESHIAIKPGEFHISKTWTQPELELPPNGWLVQDPAGKLVAWSRLADGRRQDYVDSPAYLYADGRGRFTRFPKAACDGQLIAHKQAGGSVEVIPVGACKEFGVSLDGRHGKAVALDGDRKPLGPAETRFSRGLVHIMPVPKAVSYLLTPGEKPAVQLGSTSDRVIPGEKTVLSRGDSSRDHRIPRDVKPGMHLWQQSDGAWIDFLVVPLAEVAATVDQWGDEATVEFRFRTNHFYVPHGTVRLSGDAKEHKIADRDTIRLKPEREEVREVRFTLSAEDLRHDQSWWLKSEERIAAVAEIGEPFDGGERLRKGKERPFVGNTGGHAHWNETSCGGVARRSLFMHPPYMTGPGYTFALLPPMELPKTPPAAFRCLVGKADGSDPGDGILFRIAVVNAEGKEAIATEKQWIKHAWTPVEADLGPWAGKRVRIKLVADVGPADNSSGDWAAWADLKLESREPSLVTTVHDQPVQLRRIPGPHKVESLTVAELRKAKKAVLHFQGLGLGHDRPYISTATLNRVPLGDLPGAGGDEVKGAWADASVPVPPSAIATLGRWNHLAIDNPGQDSFAVRRFWIELELADGRRASSDITQPASTQPPEWKYGQGTGVPFGKPIEIELRFQAR